MLMQLCRTSTPSSFCIQEGVGTRTCVAVMEACGSAGSGHVDVGGEAAQSVVYSPCKAPAWLAGPTQAAVDRVLVCLALPRRGYNTCVAWVAGGWEAAAPGCG